MLNPSQAGGATEAMNYNSWLPSIPTMGKPSGPTNHPLSFGCVDEPTIEEPKDDSLAWFARNLEMLRKRYGRRWILIKNNDVVDSSDDPTELQTVAEKQGIVSPYITKIPPSSTSWRTAYCSR
jgi:hypothetical protein